MIKGIIKYTAGAMLVLSIFAIVAVAGSYECDVMSFKSTILYSVACFSGMAMSGAIYGLLEDEE